MRDTLKEPFESQIESYFHDCYSKYSIDGKKIVEVQPTPTGVGGDCQIRCEGSEEWLVVEFECQSESFLAHKHNHKAIDVMFVLNPTIDFEARERQQLPKYIKHIDKDDFWRWRKYLYAPLISERVRIAEAEARKEEANIEIRKKELEMEGWLGLYKFMAEFQLEMMDRTVEIIKYRVSLAEKYPEFKEYFLPIVPPPHRLTVYIEHLSPTERGKLLEARQKELLDNR